MEVNITLSCDNQPENRRILFNTALNSAKYGRVLYILQEEITELPLLDQDFNSINRHYLKMMRFMYVKKLKTLIQTVTSLLNWQNIPSTVLIEGIEQYCPKDKLQQACGLIAFFIDTVRSCAKKLEKPCSLFISINKDCVGDHYCNVIKDLYIVN